jgi:hypothetical protein
MREHFTVVEVDDMARKSKSKDSVIIDLAFNIEPWTKRVILSKIL